MTKNWMVKDDVIARYLKACKEAAEDDAKFSVFKSNPDYTTILEHASKQLGESYLKMILKNNQWLIDTELSRGMFLSNDTFGSPKKEKYLLPDGIEIECSPSTLQYIGVLSNLLDLFETLDDKTIIEIGGGYGGQCKTIRELFDIKEYSIIDLEESAMLQDKYLIKSNCREKVNLWTDTDYKRWLEKKYDLFVSNYALTELRKEVQLNYVQNVCLQCEHGYITCNGKLNGMELLKEKFSTFKIEKDIEGERGDNFIITW